MKVSKKYRQASEQVRQKSFDIAGAVDTLLALPKAKFDETVELHVRLGVDGKNADHFRWHPFQRLYHDDDFFIHLWRNYGRVDRFRH